MKLSVSNWIFGEEPFEKSADRLARLGCDGVELLGEPERFRASEVARACSDRGLRVFSVLAMATGRRDLSHPDDSVRAHGKEYLESVLAFAQELGAGVVSTILTAVMRTDPVDVALREEDWWSGFAREWSLAVESVRELAPKAEAAGVVLAVEPINRYETYLLRTAEQARRFVAEVASPAVKVQLDTFHMGLEESDPATAIRATGGELCNVHLADSNRRAVGDGGLDWASILAALLEVGYEGPLTLEPVPPEANVFLGVRMARHEALRDRDVEVSVGELRRLLGTVPPAAA